jgi:cephalosporin hydroxylase
MKLSIDTVAGTLTRQEGDSETTLGLYTKESFEILSLQWIRAGYALKYYHTFTWFGLPILQLPEDLVRMQEVIYHLKPEVIIETGIFQGGSLLFHASLMQALGRGRVIGIDLEIPKFVRENLESHPLSARISLIEGSSADLATLEQVKQAVGVAAPVLVILDSDHNKAHVARELELYSPLVTPGSYIVATDGFMKDIWDVPRALPEWKIDNPYQAACDFAAHHPEFTQAQPKWACRDSDLTENTTYFPGGWLQRTSRPL